MHALDGQNSQGGGHISENASALHPIDYFRATERDAVLSVDRDRDEVVVGNGKTRTRAVETRPCPRRIGDCYGICLSLTCDL